MAFKHGIISCVQQQSVDNIVLEGCHQRGCSWCWLPTVTLSVENSRCKSVGCSCTPRAPPPLYHWWCPESSPWSLECLTGERFWRLCLAMDLLDCGLTGLSPTADWHHNWSTPCSNLLAPCSLPASVSSTRVEKRKSGKKSRNISP